MVILSTMQGHDLPWEASSNEREWGAQKEDDDGGLGRGLGVVWKREIPSVIAAILNP